MKLDIKKASSHTLNACDETTVCLYIYLYIYIIFGRKDRDRIIYWNWSKHDFLQGSAIIELYIVFDAWIPHHEDKKI